MWSILMKCLCKLIEFLQNFWWKNYQIQIFWSNPIHVSIIMSYSEAFIFIFQLTEPLKTSKSLNVVFEPFNHRRALSFLRYSHQMHPLHLLRPNHRTQAAQRNSPRPTHRWYYSRILSTIFWLRVFWVPYSISLWCRSVHPRANVPSKPGLNYMDIFE